MSDEGSPGRSESSTWSRLMGRLTKSSAELQADELHDASLRLGATPISALVPRQRVTVSGEDLCDQGRDLHLRPQRH